MADPTLAGLVAGFLGLSLLMTTVRMAVEGLRSAGRELS